MILATNHNVEALQDRLETQVAWYTRLPQGNNANIQRSDAQPLHQRLGITIGLIDPNIRDFLLKPRDHAGDDTVHEDRGSGNPHHAGMARSKPRDQIRCLVVGLQHGLSLLGQCKPQFGWLQRASPRFEQGGPDPRFKLRQCARDRWLRLAQGIRAFRQSTVIDNGCKDFEVSWV